MNNTAEQNKRKKADIIEIIEQCKTRQLLEQCTIDALQIELTKLEKEDFKTRLTEVQKTVKIPKGSKIVQKLYVDKHS
jgi:hypothetical protein